MVPHPAAPPPWLARRSLLVTGAGAVAVFLGGGLLAGCTSDDPLGAPDPGETRPPDPDISLRDTVISDKADLVARYDATLLRYPGLGLMLTTSRADHVAHLTLLGAEPRPLSTATRTPPATTTPTPSVGEGTAPVPTPAQPVAVAPSRERALADLVAAEKSAAARRLTQCVRAADPALARLLAAIGGCEAAHAAILRGPP